MKIHKKQGIKVKHNYHNYFIFSYSFSVLQRHKMYLNSFASPRLSGLL